MKRFILLMGCLVSSLAWANKDYDLPCFEVVKGTCSVLVVKDKETGERFESGKGACKVLGHLGMASSSAQNGLGGPYMTMDADGKITKTFPADEKYIYRFSVVTHLTCKD